MGDAPIAYVEGAGGTRVAEDQVVAVGKNDVSAALPLENSVGILNCYRSCLSKSDGSTRHSIANANHMQRLDECVLMNPARKARFLPCF